MIELMQGVLIICFHKEFHKPQHSLLSFGFFIYHVFMRINKFAVQCWLICLSFRTYCFSDVADIKTSWLWDGQDFWILEVNVNIFLSMALTQNSYFVSFETIKVYNWIVNFFFFLSDFNRYWRIALWGCLKTAVYGRGSIQRVGTLNISLLSPLAINTRLLHNSL